MCQAFFSITNKDSYFRFAHLLVEHPSLQENKTKRSVLKQTNCCVIYCLITSQSLGLFSLWHILSSLVLVLKNQEKWRCCKCMGLPSRLSYERPEEKKHITSFLTDYICNHPLMWHIPTDFRVTSSCTILVLFLVWLGGVHFRCKDYPITLKRLMICLLLLTIGLGCCNH